MIDSLNDEEFTDENKEKLTADIIERVMEADVWNR